MLCPAAGLDRAAAEKFRASRVRGRGGAILGLGRVIVPGPHRSGAFTGLRAGPEEGTATLPLRFAPYEACAGRPHLVADGAPQAGTVLTLSHWPRSGTPWPLKADTSAEIALRFLELPGEARARLGAGAALATNNHFDEDGALALFALIEPAAARSRRRLVVEAAEAGDFLVWRDPRALKVALAIGAYDDPERSPLGRDHFGRPHGEQVAARYEAVLPRIGSLLDDPDAAGFRDLWGPPLAAVEAAAAALDAGRARITESPDLDLAIVEYDRRDAPLPRLAVYPRTARHRIVWIASGQVEAVGYRYETWVQVVSRRPRPRVDLAPLLPALDRLEIDSTPGGAVAARWRFDGVGAITPRLWPSGPDGRPRPSRIPPARLVEALAARLTVGERAGGDFDPYDPDERGATPPGPAGRPA